LISALKFGPTISGWSDVDGGPVHAYPIRSYLPRDYLPIKHSRRI